MPCSPEKIAANRKNSAKSTGPKTPEGKARSRQNSLKHGLTGAGVVVPDEDVEAIKERFEAFQTDLKPRNNVALVIVQHAALLSIRMERSARHEAAEITCAMLEAEGIEADGRAEELKRLVDLIVKDPAEATRKLRRIPEGIDWMLGRWESLKADLAGPNPKWNPGHGERACELLGHKAQYNSGLRLITLSRAILGQFSLLGAADFSGLPDPQRQEAARAELARLIDSEIARLEGVREGLDHQAIDRDRAGAKARALFNTSDEAILARKYEAAAERGFFQALKQIERINAQAEEAEDIAATDLQENSCGELASSLPEPEPIPNPARGPQPAPQSAARVVPSGRSDGADPHYNPFDIQHPPHNPLVRG